MHRVDLRGFYPSFPYESVPEDRVFSENQLHLLLLLLVQPGYLPGWSKHGVAPRSPLGAAPRSLSGAEPTLTTVQSAFEFGDNYLLITSPNLMPEIPFFSPEGSSGNSPRSGLFPGILYSFKGNVFYLMPPLNTRAELMFWFPINLLSLDLRYSGKFLFKVQQTRLTHWGV